MSRPRRVSTITLHYKNAIFIVLVEWLTLTLRLGADYVSHSGGRHIYYYYTLHSSLWVGRLLWNTLIFWKPLLGWLSWYCSHRMVTRE